MISPLPYPIHSVADAAAKFTKEKTPGMHLVVFSMTGGAML